MARFLTSRILIFSGTVLVVLLAAAGVAALAGVKLPNAAGSAHKYTISGTFIVNGNCGQGGYSDLKSGASVTVKDEAGKIIGSSSINLDNQGCHFSFAVPALPKAAFYSVEVSHRGAVSYSFEEMKSMHWQLALSIGS